MPHPDFQAIICEQQTNPGINHANLKIQFGSDRKPADITCREY
jgi:hypothetical protein